MTCAQPILRIRILALALGILPALTGQNLPADPPSVAPPSGAPLAKPGAEKPADKPAGFAGRSREGRKRLIQEWGGSRESEEAVMLGLAWLAQQQQQDGHWAYDRGHTNEHAASTGMAVLAFLGAGQSHQEGRFRRTVQAGVDWLAKNVEQGNDPRTRGRFRTVTTAYSQGIAALALCEAYGMTRDPKLREPAQAAIDYIQAAQAQDGSWGYQFGNSGDTSIVGWQLQALHAAKMTQDLTVKDEVIRKASKFLDRVSRGQDQSTYGYNTPSGSHATSLTAIGLLCRYYFDGWRRDRAGFAEGSLGLLRRAPVPNAKEPFDIYFHYYATQVVRFYGGDEWKNWNEGTAASDGTRPGGFADWLIGKQDKQPAHRGSWDGEPYWIGRECGRLGTTCMCLLTLEVYYRYVPETGPESSDKE